MKPFYTLNFQKIMMLLIGIILLQIPLIDAQASDLIQVSPVTNNILMLRFDDGHIDYYGEGQTWWKGQDNNLYYSPLNLTDATNTSNYTITSSDDGTWGTVSPNEIGRKTKAGDYNAPNAPNDGNPEFILEHQMYLKLPKAMVSGKTYTITVGDLADNLNSFTFVFDEKRLRSETVHVNQIGFPNSGKKIAYLSHWMGDLGNLDLNNLDGAPFNIVRYSDGQVVYPGTITFRQEHDRVIHRIHNGNSIGTTPYENHTHADIAECDFSSFTTSGEYVVSVPGIGCSFPFKIGNEVVNEAFYTAMKGIFYQRASIAQELPDGSIYPRDHHPDDVTHRYVHDDITDSHVNYTNSGFTNSTTYTQVSDVWGWYHDASDWDSYAVHYKIPINLMLLYDLAPDKFYDGEIGNRYKLNDTDANWIDEGTNGLPDLLDEAGWLVKFGKRARHALMAQGLGTGGVPGYVGREGGTGGESSYNDTREWAITAENPAHTMGYAAIASYYAFCLNEFHHLSNPSQNHPDCQMWINEAIDAYNWSVANGGTSALNWAGGYHTIAAFNLFRATGQTTYKNAVTANFGNNDQNNWHIEAANTPTGWLSGCIIALHPEVNIDAGVRSQAEENVTYRANALVDRGENVGYRYGAYDEDSYSLGMFANPKVMVAGPAHVLTGNQDYLSVVEHQMSYVLGGNQLNKVFITQLGERKLQKAVHHIDSWYMSDPNSMVYTWEPLPGISTYFGAANNWVGGVGSHHWTRSSAYPVHDNSPRSEMNFPNRESINGSEYTTHQQGASWVYASGYLKAAYGNQPSGNAHNPRPTVSLNLSDGQQFSINGNTTLTANTSSDTRRVEYYYDWHYIGESLEKANNFAFDWEIGQTNLNTGENVLITAVAYDDEGMRSAPTSGGDKNVSITSGGGSDFVTVSPTSHNYTDVAGSFDLTVSSSMDWSASDNQEWISTTKVNSSTLRVAVQSNSNTSSRSGNVTVTAGSTSQIVNISQDGNTPSGGQTPYGGTAWSVPGTIQAEDYDNGGEGVAYYEGNNINKGGQYRSDGVDIQTSTDASGYNVGWIASGEWLEYTVDVAQSGTYTIEARVASNSGGGAFEISFSNGATTGDVSVAATGGFQNWTTVSAKAVSLTAGEQVMRIDMKSGGFNLNYVNIVSELTCSATGSILLERYNGIVGSSVSNLTSASKYPGSPDATSNPISFEAPSNVADSYGLRMRGYLCPPTTGSYTFWISGDDNVELWLSTNNSEANKTRIAYHTSWTASKDWNKFTTQKSASFTLQAGTNYYIEALMKENSGGDNLAVGWAKPGQATTAPSEVIPGSALIPAVGSTTVTNNCGSVTNSSFENNLSGWTTGVHIAVSTNANLGSKAAVLGTADGGIFYGTNITASPGNSIALDAYAKTEGAPSWAGLGFDYLDASGTKISGEYVDISATGYTNYSLTGTAPANTASISIWAWKSGTVGKLYLDDVCLIINGVNGVNSVTSANFAQDQLMISLEQIKIYPNPTAKRMTIDLGRIENASIEIVDIIGKKVMERKSVGGSIELDLPKGIYIMRLHHGGELTSFKLIFQ